MSTLQLTALAHKKDINLEGFFHCQSSQRSFLPHQLQKSNGTAHPYSDLFSFSFFFFP